jgi:hypothetical protein
MQAWRNAGVIRRLHCVGKRALMSQPIIEGGIDMTTEATTIALKALRKGNISTTELWELTQWAARPSATFLSALAARHGFKHTSKADNENVIRHTFIAKAPAKQRATKAAA